MNQQANLTKSLMQSGIMEIDKNVYVANPNHATSQPQYDSEGNLISYRNDLSSSGIFGINKAAHPTACLFHLILKVIPVGIYFIFPIFLSAKISTYIGIIIFSAIDFWTTKNITGRLLVGLRWWSEPQLNGKDKWFFECKIEEVNDKRDEYFFWISLVVFIIGWLFLGVMNFFVLNYGNVHLYFHIYSNLFLIIQLVGIIFAEVSLIVNFYAFFKCSRDQKNRMAKIISEAKKKGMYLVMNQAMKNIKMPMNVPAG